MTDKENFEGITSLKHEMGNIKKTNDLALLDIGSGLDEMELKQNLISLASENEKLKSVISKNENEVRMLNHTNAEKESIINQLIEENTKLKNAHPDKINVLTNENNELYNVITDLSTYGSENENISLQQSISVLNDKLNIMNTELINKDNEIDFLNGKLEESSLKADILNEKIVKNDEKTSELINKNNDLIKNLADKDAQIKVLKNNIAQKYSNIADTLNSKLNQNKKTISDKNDEINSLKGKISSLNNEINSLNGEISGLNSETNSLLDDISILNTQNSQLIQEKEKLESIQQQYARQLLKLDINKYFISSFKDEIENNHLEIQYLKNETGFKKLSNPLAYIYLIFKSSPKELSINFKLYRAIKNSKSFDIGFYLKNNTDIQNSKWCKYFSPQLHYVCSGFKEKRMFTKKYFNTNSKKELLEDILNSK